jgi:epoxyqueuosine reductase QueG
LGWLGKCGLLVTKEYGSGIRISSLLTNAKLNCGKPIEKSFCGSCMECVKNCPGEAITGKLWDINIDRSELIDVEKCQKTAMALSKKNINTIGNPPALPGDPNSLTFKGI